MLRSFVIVEVLRHPRVHAGQRQQRRRTAGRLVRAWRSSS